MLPEKTAMIIAGKFGRPRWISWVFEKINAFIIFDKTYIDYEKFDYYCEQNTRFVNHLKSNALVVTLEDYQQDTESTINSNVRIGLGKTILIQVK